MKKIIYLASSALVIAFAMNAPASAQRVSGEGGGNYKASPRISGDGPRMGGNSGRVARMDRDGGAVGGRISKFDGRIEGRVARRGDGNWDGNWKPRRHFRHRDRNHIVRFGVPLATYYDYDVAYYDDRCGKYYRWYIRTGNPYWLDKYEDCID